MDEALRNSVMRRLDMFDSLDGDRPEHVLPQARTELYRLVQGWRLLLSVHQCDPAESGRHRHCAACPGRRRWPCPVWLMAQRHLLGEDAPGHR